MLAKVAIVGRPNVGKSTLFNRVIGKNKAIVHKVSGTTRDRNDYEVFWKDRKFIITDTAGWNIDVSLFSKDILRQINAAVSKSNILLFVVDGKTGVHPVDFSIARQIRLVPKKTILVVNKIDTQMDEIKGYEFYKLGFDDIIFISANHGRNVHSLLDKVCKNVKCGGKIESIEEMLKIVIVGKPNVGKSSFINAVAGEERSIVSDIPGTTRDSLMVRVHIRSKEYVLVDTAGVRRGSKVKDDMEYLSFLSASYAIESADVAVLIADASQGIGETEVKIARLLLEKKKPVILAVNKWDLVEEKEAAAKCFVRQLRKRIKFMSWTDIVFVSAKTCQRLEWVFQKAEVIFKEYSKKLAQEEINEAVRDIVTKKSYTRKGKVLKLLGCVQAASMPPVFVFSVNDTALLHFSYERFIENCLRDKFGFRGTPIVLKFKKYCREKTEVTKKELKC